ncbi:hypothetical protein T484DRAFT_1882849 [Baffinella frigidus]|nr:hypothetical protein T484DRAFT_1882849 [Cryptophyta sp. CCMP2293]|mmetsp:Transcript_54764/g.130060  ORF Transcript_54764/g.130060 Transcript_54764/m.130060 type:complete len:165 (-) Transcript_54764:26-520(-)
MEGPMEDGFWHPASEHCAACASELPIDGERSYAHDHTFCSEGCRCVFLTGWGALELRFGDETEAATVEDCGSILVGKTDYECPCLNGDALCPHFASRGAGLVKHKFPKCAQLRWQDPVGWWGHQAYSAAWNQEGGEGDSQVQLGTRSMVEVRHRTPNTFGAKRP